MSDPRNIVLGPRKGPSVEDIKRQAEAMVAGLDMSKLGPPDHLDRLRAALEAGPTPGPWETKGRKIYLGVTGRQGNGFPPDDEDYEEWPDSLGIIYDEGGHSVMDAAYIAAASPDVIAALLSERDALAAVAEAARYLTGPDVVSFSAAWGDIHNALAAYDRTVAKP